MKIQDVKILVVDDVNAIRVQIREILRRVGFEKINVCGNGLEAQKRLAEKGYHLVLSDWRMEPIDGLDLLKIVKKDTELKEMAFIMVTAEKVREQVILALQAGVDDYVVKPLTFDQVQSKIFKVLVKKKILL